MRRSFTIISVVVHGVVLAAACLVQVLAVGPLPDVSPTPLSFVGAVPVRVVDIPLARPRGGGGSGASPAGASSAAPTEAPSAIAEETRSECVGCAIVDNVGVERGIGSPDLLGTVDLTPAAPPPAPRTPIRLHGGMQPPRKLTHVDPVYPRVAQATRVEGVVILEAVIDVDGAVTSVRVLRSIPLLDHAAIDAVHGWKFTPTLLNGVPVPIALTVTVRFALSDR
jgi:TonB family protein